MQVFLHRGYDGATLSQLAEASGLSKASLYHHYPGGKAEMAGTLLRNACSRAQQLAYDKLQPPGEAAEQLMAFLDGFERYTERGTQHCLVCVLAQAADGQHAEDARRALADWREQVTNAYDALLNGRGKRAARLAEQMLAELYGALLTAVTLDEPRLLRRAVKRWRKAISGAIQPQHRKND